MLRLSHLPYKMGTVRSFYCFISSLSFIILMFFIYRQRKDGFQWYPKTHSFNLEIEPQLDTDEEVYGDESRYKGKIHSNLIPLKLKIRQYTRQKLVHDLCRNSSTMDIRGKWQTFDQVPQNELHNLLVDNQHGIIYCYVPKVACTAWKRIMIFLSQTLKVDGKPYRNPADIPIEKIHASSLQHLNAYPKAVMKQKLKTYKKFIFVRDPFVRLISAYRDKLQNTNQFYYETIGMEILNTFGNVSNPPKSVEKAHADGIVPSFYHFIQYILSLPAGNDKEFDEHWRQTIHLCHPCLIKYDFIGKMETIEEDAAHLLQMLHLNDVVNFQAWKTSRTEPSWIKTWFTNIPTELRRKLYKIYAADFRLFGYEYQDNLDPEN